MAGYSGTPLTKKLGIREGYRVWLVNAPRGFRATLDDLPESVRLVSQSSRPLDVILFFVKSRSRLLNNFSKLASKLAPAGMLWIAWPKRASGVATDLSDNIVRGIGLDAGLVDTKVCAIDDVWSGLRFVIRVKDRQVTHH